MPYFQKKPVVVEAVWNVPGNEHAVVDLLNKYKAKWWAVNNHGLRIETLEGVMSAHRNDWIIAGVEGEVYPCRDDIFRKTYEAAPEHKHPAEIDPSQLPLFY